MNTAWPNEWWLSERWFRLGEQIVFAYGRNRARDILGGYDLATNADLAKWRRLISLPERQS